MPALTQLPHLGHQARHGVIDKRQTAILNYKEEKELQFMRVINICFLIKEVVLAAGFLLYFFILFILFIIILLLFDELTHARSFIWAFNLLMLSLLFVCWFLFVLDR